MTDSSKVDQGFVGTRASDSLATGNCLSTPSSAWRANGEKDPHGDHYDCQRADLMHGELTDDQLANAVFLYPHDDKEHELRQILKAGPTSGTLLMAAKERIRWLSRIVENQAAELKELRAKLNP